MHRLTCVCLSLATQQFTHKDQFCLDQHQMTATNSLSKKQMQEQVVSALQKSIKVPNKVLMLLQ